MDQNWARSAPNGWCPYGVREILKNRQKSAFPGSICLFLADLNSPCLHEFWVIFSGQMDFLPEKRKFWHFDEKNLDLDFSKNFSKISTRPKNFRNPKNFSKNFFKKFFGPKFSKKIFSTPDRPKIDFFAKNFQKIEISRMAFKIHFEPQGAL